MNIGQAAEASGINAKLIRHYESIGVLPRAKRSGSGYRQYSDDDIHVLRFVKRARSLGFSMKEIKKLVNLWRNRSRASSDVKKMILIHIQGLENKIRDLQAMQSTLLKLADHCRGDDRPSCPILDDLSSSSW